MKYLVGKTWAVALVYLVFGADGALAARPVVDRAAWKEVIRARNAKRISPIATIQQIELKVMEKPAIRAELQKILEKKGQTISDQQLDAEVEAQHANLLKAAEESRQPIFSNFIFEDLESGAMALDERAARSYLSQQFAKADPAIAQAMGQGTMALKTVTIDGQERKLLLVSGQELAGFSAQRDAYLILELPSGLEITHGYVDQSEFRGE